MARTTPQRTIDVDAPAPAREVVAEHGTSWEERSRVVLTPIAPPSILGLYGFAGATFIVAANLAGWYGNSSSPEFLFPFAAIFGGIAQFIAGLYAYRARDGLATAMHGMWGSFWIAYGILYLLFAVGTLTEPQGAFPELAFWFIALGAITAMGTVAALAESIGLTSVLGTLAAGSGFAAAGFGYNNDGLVTLAGYLFVASALLAFYVASAMMLEGTWGRVVLPLGKYKANANIPGRSITSPLEYESGMPGAKAGQ